MSEPAFYSWDEFACLLIFLAKNKSALGWIGWEVLHPLPTLQVAFVYQRSFYSRSSSIRLGISPFGLTLQCHADIANHSRMYESDRQPVIRPNTSDYAIVKVQNNYKSCFMMYKGKNKSTLGWIRREIVAPCQHCKLLSRTSARSTVSYSPSAWDFHPSASPSSVTLILLTILDCASQIVNPSFGLAHRIT